MNNIIIACKTISDELNMALEDTSCSYPVIWIESGLHLDPDALRRRIQEEINKITDFDYILLAFGLCGNSLIGLKSDNHPMIFPRVDDCITLFLGSQENRKEISSEAGTYFLTKGWLNYEKNLWEEYKETVSRYGKARADRIYKKLLQHYKRLGIIDTGAYNLEEFLVKAKLMAEDLNLDNKVIPGSLYYLKKLLTGPWDDSFVVVNRGEIISMSHMVT